MACLSLAGKRFGRLTVVAKHPINTIHGKVNWECTCDCGSKCIVIGACLTRGSTTSCGCYKAEIQGTQYRTHGLSRTNHYQHWKAMRRRCNDPNTKHYDRYGGRGITVCDRWNDYLAFLEDMGPMPSPKHSLDRIDNDGNYSPENCRWATGKEQCRNHRRTLFFTHEGQTRCFQEWCEVLGIDMHRTYMRLRRGWPFEKAINPIMYRNKR